MKPAVRIFLKQTCRSTKRLVLQLVLLCVVTAFFVVSLNLYSNSGSNLLTVENTYKTIATMEVYGNINRKGELVASDAPDRLGFRLIGAKSDILSPLFEMQSVQSVDLRYRCAVYIPGEVPVRHIATKEDIGRPLNTVDLFSCDDMIRFKLDQDEPLEIPLMIVPDDEPSGIAYVKLPIQLLAQNLTDIQYSDVITLSIPTIFEKQMVELEDDIRRLNRSDRIDVITLYPDVEYMMMGTIDGFFERDPVTQQYVWAGSNTNFNLSEISFTPSTSLYYQPGRIAYHSMGSSVDIELAMVGNPYGIQRYEDVKNDLNWQKNEKCIEYTNHAFTATLTKDISTIPAWYKGGMYLQEGRMITAEEYASGARVCMISAQLADYQGWQVGDKLNMHYFTFDAYPERSDAMYPLTSPWYYRELDGFFHQGEYEIVGIFGQQEVVDIGDAAEEVFYNPWNTIYVPTNSVENAPEPLVQASTLTLNLKNGSIDEFKAAVEEMGLTDQVPGEYEIKFSYFDQGYSKIQPGLVEMNRNAVLLLGLSAILLLVTMILTAFLFSRQHKHSAGILRMLGGSKGQAFTAILVCAASVVAAGGIVGTILGGALTQSVGTSILGDVESTTVDLATGANAGLTILTGAGCIALFLLLTAACTATYIGKEPRELLPKDQA